MKSISKSTRKKASTNKFYYAVFSMFIASISLTSMWPALVIAQETAAPSLGIVMRTARITDIEILLALIILVYGLLMLAAAVALIRFTPTSPEVALQLVALIIIVTGILFLIAAGFKSQDIAPAIGLLGTIAGYLLGRARGSSDSNQDKT